MSFFNWFSKKESPKPASSINQTLVRGAGGPSTSTDGRSQGPNPEPSSHRRAERIERREQLYGVVRDAMTRAGVLSASYKFKVLSLDSRGGSYLIMTDLSSQAAIDAQRSAEIESLIAQTAKNRHDILVAAVYWRLSDHVTAGLSAKSLAQAAAPLSAANAQDQSQEVDLTEMLAFKSAFASAAVVEPLSASGEILKSKRRNPAPQPPFENTEILDAEERAPLGVTQYGELR